MTDSIKKMLESKDYSEVAKELVKELLKISESEDFISGVLGFADNEDDRKTILNYVKENTRTYGDVTQLTYELNIKRYGKPEIIITDD